MTLEELKQSQHIIFEAISGSRAYGLATTTSDTDIRGVFILPKDQFYGLNYIGQINDDTNDIVYYELRKFTELLLKNNPNILELLNMPEDCILYEHDVFKQFKKELFLSKLCKDSIANYAYSQIKKARGLNKKIVNPVDKKRKTILDFCYVRTNKDAKEFYSFVKNNNLDLNHFGLSKIPHLKDCYNLFYNEQLYYKGIAIEDANDVCLSSIPKAEHPIGMLYFNKDGYSTYCKRYKDYWDWVNKRNNARYENNIAHGKNYDTKNMMHTFRLLFMAKDIAKGKLVVRRNNREQLLNIKKGKFEYDDLVKKAEELKNELDKLYKESSLQDKPNIKKVNTLLVTIRNQFYNS